MRRVAVLVVAFLAGALGAPFVASAWFFATNTCTPGPGEPCDGGPIVVMGLTIVLAPILGAACALLAEIAIRSRRRSGGQ